MKPQITAIGNLTKTPELEKSKNGNSFCRFTIACNGGKDNKDTTFLWCIAYKSTAENICKYLEKGSGIFIIGELSEYISEKDKLSHFYCDVARVQFLGKRKSENKPSESNEEKEEDNVPF